MKVGEPSKFTPFEALPKRDRLLSCEALKAAPGKGAPFGEHLLNSKNLIQIQTR